MYILYHMFREEGWGIHIDRKTDHEARIEAHGYIRHVINYNAEFFIGAEFVLSEQIEGVLDGELEWAGTAHIEQRDGTIEPRWTFPHRRRTRMKADMSVGDPHDGPSDDQEPSSPNRGSPRMKSLAAR